MLVVVGADVFAQRCLVGGYLIQEQLLSRNVERFRGGLVSEAHRWFCHSTLGSRVMNKKKKKKADGRVVRCRGRDVGGGGRGRLRRAMPPRGVAFDWELTKETIHLPLGCLQGGVVYRWERMTPLGSPVVPDVYITVTIHFHLFITIHYFWTIHY